MSAKTLHDTVRPLLSHRNNMTRTIHCSFLDRDAEALERAPWPGELGQRIYENISLEAWNLWQERQVMLINEYQLNTMDEKAVVLLENHMKGFLFAEGDYVGALPDGFKPRT